MQVQCALEFVQLNRMFKSTENTIRTDSYITTFFLFKIVFRSGSARSLFYLDKYAPYVAYKLLYPSRGFTITQLPRMVQHFTIVVKPILVFLFYI